MHFGGDSNDGIKRVVANTAPVSSVKRETLALYKPPSQQTGATAIGARPVINIGRKYIHATL